MIKYIFLYLSLPQIGPLGDSALVGWAWFAVAQETLSAVAFVVADPVFAAVVVAEKKI